MDIQKTDDGVLMALTNEQLKNIWENAATIGAKEALKTFNQEQKKEQGKRANKRLRNTRLLLRNYHVM